MSRFRNWWLGLPYPLWVLSACKPFSPLCLIDDLAHAWFPMTFGFSGDKVSHSPIVEPWICRRHAAMEEKWNRKHYPEYFDFSEDE